MIPTQFQVHDIYWRERIERVPAMQTTNWDLDKPNRLLTEFMKDRGIKYVDLLPDLRRQAESSDREFYLVQDNHWNETGHAIAARLIVDALQASFPSL